MRNPIIPIHFPAAVPPPDGISILAADIGGTKTDMALFELRGGVPALLRSQRYPSQAWQSLAAIVRDFQGDSPMAERFCISFAGPIVEGRAHGTNLHWDIDSLAIAAELGIQKVFLINDLEANCYGLAALETADLRVVYPGNKTVLGNAAVISPGTGLGEGGLYWDGAAYRPFATEGGHAHFAARNEMDWELYCFLKEKYQHVSWERVVSGPGISVVFAFLHEVKQWEAPTSLLEDMKLHDPAATISQAAATGSPICQTTLEMFMRYLAAEAANLTLKLKATGGVFLGGGILPKIWNDQLSAVFHQYFFDVGRLHPLVEAAPVYLILNQQTALWGAGYYGAFGG